jgi:hypothetical protein
MKVHNLVVTGSLQSGGENITSISSSVASTVTNVSSSVSASIGQLSSSMASSMTSLSSSLTSSIGSLSSSMMTSMNDLSSSIKGMMATTSSNVFVGNQTISGSIVPAVNGTYDLGSSTHEFRHLYLSSASLYIDGTKVLGSTTQELQITTDAGQSFKILEAGSDTITLQAADGNITLATSGGGDVILDPTTGVIALKGTTTIYAGNKVLSSDGNAIQFGNSVTMTGSLIVTGFIETQELRTTYISSSILYRSGSTKFGDELGDTHSFTGSLTVSGSISIPGSGLVSGSSQITYSELSGVPSGIISGSAQLPSGLISGSSQLPSGLVSGSAQITLSSTTGYGSVLNQAVLTTSSPTFAGLTNNSTYSQSTTSTQPVMIYGDSGDTNGLFRIQMDSISDSFGTGARTFLGDGGIDIFLGTSNSSYTPGNTYIALNHGGEISMGAGSATKHFILSTSGDATFTGTGTFSGGGNTLTLKKGTGSPAIALAGTSDQATGLIEGVSGGGIKFYTSTGTLSSPSWSTKLLITPSDGIKFGPNAVSIIGTEGSHGFHYLYSAGNPKIYLEANGVAAFLNPNGVGVNDANPSKRLTVNYGATGSDGLYVYGSQRQNTIFRSTGEHCFLYIDSFHQNTYLPVIHFQRSSTTYGAIGLNRASNSDALGSWTESEMYVGTETNTPISLKVNNERIVIVSSSSMQVKSTILPTSDATYNLGSTSLRWNHVYTTDLHLSNEGKQNVVDGTWGDWTLQEGENDIYMLNNRSGEKFKIKLEKIIE